MSISRELVLQRAIEMAEKKPFVDAVGVLEHIDVTRPVKVYRNLHKKCLSVQQDGLVRCHTKNISLLYFKTMVNRAGRDKVRLEKRKNVHAFVKGFVLNSPADGVEYMITSGKGLPFSWSEMTYNPYKNDHWTEKETGKHVDSGKFLEIVDNQVWIFDFLYLKDKNETSSN